LGLWIPKWDDTLIIFIFAVIFTLAREFAQKFFLRAAAYFQIDQHERLRFSESSWKLLFYVIACIYGGTIVWKCDYFPDTIRCWLGWPNIPITFSEKMYYLFQLGFYWHSLYAHFKYEVKRSDFWPLFFHHIVTIWLIYFSYVTNFHRIGILVLLCHDPNDVCFEFGKLWVYKQQKL